jgi:hypothetical protein
VNGFCIKGPCPGYINSIQPIGIYMDDPSGSDNVA